MFRRLILWGLRSYIGGPAKSWVFTSAALLLMRVVRSASGRRELIDLASIKPGDTVVIEHLPISHKRQIKQFKKDKKAAKRARRAARRLVAS